MCKGGEQMLEFWIELFRLANNLLELTLEVNSVSSTLLLLVAYAYTQKDKEAKK